MIPGRESPRMVIEDYRRWIVAQARLRQVKAEGYRGMATLMDGYIRVFIAAGKHPDLSRLPGRVVGEFRDGDA